MQIDSNMPFDPVRRDALLAILRQMHRVPILHNIPYADNDERNQRRYWPDFLRWANRVLTGEE